MRINFAALLLLCPAIVAAKAGPPSTSMPAGEGPWVVEAHFSSTTVLNRLLQRSAPWKVNRQAGVLTIEVENRADYRRLLDDGFTVAVDPELTAETYAPVAHDARQPEGIPGFLCYRTVEETYTRADQLVAQAPGIVELVDIGDSWRKTQNAAQGYDLKVLRLTNRSIAGPKPAHYLQGGLHAREYVTSETVTRYAEFLVSRYGIDPDVTWLLDSHEIHILLHANPDGRKIAEASSTRMQRKNRNENFCPTGGTTVGVDLNRNFPFDWGGAGSSSTACSDTYRGPTADSEVEAQAIIDYLRQIFPDQRDEQPGVDLTTPISLDAQGVYMDVHSNAARTWWPWGNVDDTLAPNANQLQTFGRKISYYNQYRPEQSNAGGAIGGATDDFTFGTLGVPAFTIELGGSSFFPDCMTYETTIAQRNIDGFYFASKVARRPYRLPGGPELVGATASPAVITSPVATTRLTVRADDTRYNNSAGTEPSQAITRVDVFLTPPGPTAPRLSARWQRRTAASIRPTKWPSGICPSICSPRASNWSTSRRSMPADKQGPSEPCS
ncbi:M14 family zinc carboxypeptidase [Tahibacter amnicola]|uniref:M14 family zinc carboxypeptidase n=1 Tax=Tahibacter amnicola TaxID=2976241 RepID=A0ABY6BC59_9GAMM|nr:M14 family zinc carboxypeptidase [Tahibacter amnicola]UXI65905.1 M14 family zinc carboxypeptidase [Tahibacter amnicola]